MLGMGRTGVLGEKAEQDGPCSGRLGLLGGSMRAPVLAGLEQAMTKVSEECKKEGGSASGCLLRSPSLI